jgi:hypothetical protein
MTIFIIIAIVVIGFMVFKHHKTIKQIQQIKQTPNIQPATLHGYSGECTIKNKHGNAVITITNPDKLGFNVLATVEKDLRAELRIQNKTKDIFVIALFDANAFTEDNIKLDCSKEPVVVNWTVIFETAKTNAES